MGPDCIHVVIWEFLVKADWEGDFVNRYGEHGEWARLFRTGTGYIRTELVKDANQANRYLTIDYWTSQQAYARFKEENKQAYESIDKSCEPLTQGEHFIGSFHLVSPAVQV